MIVIHAIAVSRLRVAADDMVHFDADLRRPCDLQKKE